MLKLLDAKSHTDGTLEKLLKIDGITILIKPNGGTASALNTGIRNAKGHWIKWISADDVMYTDCLQMMMSNTTRYQTRNIFRSNLWGLDSQP